MQRSETAKVRQALVERCDNLSARQKRMLVVLLRRSDVPKQGGNAVKLPRRNVLHLVAGATALLTASRAARAETYPTTDLARGSVSTRYPVSRWQLDTREALAGVN